MKKVAEPKYVVWNDGESIVGDSLADLKQNLTDAFEDTVEDDDPWEMPVYKYVGMLKLEAPKAPPLVITLPKGV